MDKKSILLTGYYGFGNLGDDLLFLCNYNLLQRLYPGCLIDVATESPSPVYLDRLVAGNLRYVKMQAKGSYDIIWHGGGGVFFDFKKGGMGSAWINRLIRVAGVRTFTRGYGLIKKLTGKPLIKFKKRIGLGIGVGHFTPSSVKYRTKIRQLGSFDYLNVRDEDSRTNAVSLCKGLKIDVSTDIVFDTQLWMPEIDSKKTGDHKGKKIGVVLRDWKFTDGYDYIADLFLQLSVLKTQGYRVEFFSFDKAADINYINYCHAAGEQIHVWDPHTMKIGEYVEMLQNQDIFITSRFHGAIIGTCLNIPGICLAIEPKLKTVIGMTEDFYHLQELPLPANGINELVHSMADHPGAATAILARNRAKLGNVYKKIAELE